MSAAERVGTTAGHGAHPPWPDVLLSAIACVSWALVGMAGTAALGLHLLGADSAASLGPMTAAVVALGAGGAVKPSGDVSAFGLKGAEAHTAIQITPLGVGLAGALLLSYFFLRSLRTAGVVIAPAELLARAGAVVALFVAMTGGLAWAGHDVVTIDGGSLGLDRLPGGGGAGGVSIPGLGDLGNIGGLLPDNIGKLIDARAAVGFTVDTAPTLLGGLCWSAGVLFVALLASRRTPLPGGWQAVHRVVRPAVSSLVSVLLVAVVAGLAAAGYAAVGDAHPRRIAGAALLGAPNGVWLGIPVGLFVPWDGRATGELAKLLPHPLDQLLTVHSDQPVTLGRLAQLDGRVWLLGIAAALMMLLAGVLTAVRTPVAAGPPAPGSGRGALGFAGRCALRLGVVTALALPILAWLTEVSVDASLSVLGFDAFGAGIELHGHLGTALLLGAVWGAGAGAAGALLATATGAAGRRASPLALGAPGNPATPVPVAGTAGRGAGVPTRSPAAGAAGYNAGASGGSPAAGAAGYGAVSGGSPAGGIGGRRDGEAGGREATRRWDGAEESGPGTTREWGGAAGPGEPHGSGNQQAGPYAAGRPGRDGRAEPYAPGYGRGAPGAPGARDGRAGIPASGARGGRAGSGGPGDGDGPAGSGGARNRDGSAGRAASGPGTPGSGPGPGGGGGVGGGPAGSRGAGEGGAVGQAGPYAPGVPYRPPNAATNPYLQLPGEVRDGSGDEDVAGAPTMIGPVPPPRPPKRRPRPRAGEWPPPPPDDAPPSPPPPRPPRPPKR
ncbi:streptophobe family protein [Streptomyces anandii]|uniref:streptophobe family protein n=1 Tax=Streptomyces anandii TaxID=285454 RepID=UPI0036F9148B